MSNWFKRSGGRWMTHCSKFRSIIQIRQIGLSHIEKRSKGQESSPFIVGGQLGSNSESNSKFIPGRLKTPKEIKKYLDRFVIGQNLTKKILSVAVHKHYNRINHNQRRKATGSNNHKPQSQSNYDSSHNESGSGAWSVEISDNDQVEGDDISSQHTEEFDLEKSNILIAGPTGSGKTHIVKHLANALDVPFCVMDCTSLTEAGYVGESVESFGSKLFHESKGKIEIAQRGICYFDEIDKLAGRAGSNGGRDVSGEGVQQALLKVLEGSSIEIKTGKDQMGKEQTIIFDTTDVLFICSGAFTHLPDQVARRVTKKSLGFTTTQQEQSRGVASMRQTREEAIELDNEMYRQAEAADFIKLGMIPECIGRLPIFAPIDGLSRDDLRRILIEPENAAIKQFETEFKISAETELEFTDDAIDAIVQIAIERGTGARGLRSILEKILLHAQYEIPKSDITKVIVSRDAVTGSGEVEFIREQPEVTDSETGSQTNRKQAKG
jgi:ATP-dependent Clp protease ATP-binding subunit ClpX